MQTYNWQDKIQWILTAVAWVCIGYFIIMAITHYVVWILNPFPNEYLEGVALSIVDLMARGINPFSDHAPQSFFYMYGFITSWLALCIGNLFDLTSYVPYRLISICCTVLSGLLIAFEVSKHCRSRALIVLSFLLMLVTSWVLHEANARPDQLAMLFSITTLVIAGRYYNRMAGLIILALLTVVTFYTKQYFLLVGVEVFAFLLFVSKKKALSFAILLSLLLLGSVIAVNYYFPYYFTMTMFAYGAQNGGIKSSIAQNVMFVAFYWPLLLFFVVSLVAMWRQNKIKFYFTQINRPFIVFLNATGSDKNAQPDFRLMIYRISFFIAFLALLPLGCSTGAYMSYFYQLLLPPTIVVGIFALDVYCPRQWQPSVILLICVCSLFHYSLPPYFYPYRGFNFTRFLTCEEKKNWEKAYAILATANGKNVCLEAPIFVDYAIKNGIECYNNGHTTGGAWTELTWNRMHRRLPKLTEMIFPMAQEIARRNMQYRNRVIRKMEAHEFDLIVTEKNYSKRYIPLEKNYQLNKMLILRTNHSIKYYFWVPKR